MILVTVILLQLFHSNIFRGRITMAYKPEKLLEEKHFKRHLQAPFLTEAKLFLSLLKQQAKSRMVKVDSRNDKAFSLSAGINCYTALRDIRRGTRTLAFLVAERITAEAGEAAMAMLVGGKPNGFLQFGDQVLHAVKPYPFIKAFVRQQNELLLFAWQHSQRLLLSQEEISYLQQALSFFYPHRQYAFFVTLFCVVL